MFQCFLINIVVAYSYIMLTVFFMLIYVTDFFNWNRVKLMYCDGASFAGDLYDEVCGMQIYYSLLQKLHLGKFYDI